MKKIFILSYSITAFIFVSCAKKQTWHCECGYTGASAVTYTTTITNATKSNASDLCYKAAANGSAMPANSYACNVSPE